MTITVSISQYRQHIADYLLRNRQGHTITIKDEKRGEVIADVIPRKKFDPVAYREMLERVAGTYTTKNHPEWATKKKVERWLRRGRLADERTFDVHA